MQIFGIHQSLRSVEFWVKLNILLFFLYFFFAQPIYCSFCTRALAERYEMWQM